MPSHVVQFYEDEQFLREVVADYMIAGLRAHETLIVIATEEHRVALVRSLQTKGWPVDELLKTGKLIMIDATETLANSKRGGTLDYGQLTDWIRVLLDKQQLLAPGTPIRVYGELCLLLWDEERLEDCRRLEEIWHELSNRYPLSLLCAYRMHPLSTALEQAAMQTLGSLHAHVLPSEHCASQRRMDTRLRYLFLLEERVRTQATELQQGREIETVLRRTISDHDLQRTSLEIVGAHLEILQVELEAAVTLSQKQGVADLIVHVQQAQQMALLIRRALEEMALPPAAPR